MPLVAAGSGGDSVVPLVQRDRASVGVWFFAGSTFVMVWCLVFAPAYCHVVTGVEAVCVGHFFPFLFDGTTAECQYLSRAFHSCDFSPLRRFCVISFGFGC
ncbi:hypothetical protein TSUD_393890 [Trifolium subterraneum]|uniref:Uncharacterized protein n=1 Tax=Trifolium subterraneum TaxID=3900 RepID=A0A2Z6MQ68_TRISU|nr:hypothetical protein TSUD_393890 [Trifolium subterraneum]